jgi:uncharacterized protein (TIGR03435 family)
MGRIALPLILGFAWIAAAVMPAASQTPAQKPAFAVASILHAKPEQGFHGGSCRGVDSQYRPQFASTPPPLGRCVFSSTTLQGVIEFAYKESAQPFLIVSGGDKWISSDLFKVEAVAENPANTTQEQLRLMLQRLLQDRFKVRFHLERHEEQGFALLTATTNGPTLQAPAGNSTRPGVMVIGRDGSGLVAKGEPVDLKTFANFLSSDLQQPVQDDTGLDGIYDIVLKWTPSAGEIRDANDSRNVAAEPLGPSLFTALREQLGLRLEARKIMIPALVIDHAEKPDVN